MSIREAAAKHKSLCSRIEETIIPLQEQQKLWNDDKFFAGVKDMLSSGNFTEARISEIVARALFDIKKFQPDVEVVKNLIKAFPKALNCKDAVTRSDFLLLPIHMLLAYYCVENGRSESEMGYFGAKYINILALEGMKYNVGGENMRGGLLNNVYDNTQICKFFVERNMLQNLVVFDHGENDLNALKELHRNELLVKNDIVDQHLVFYSSLNEKSEKFEYIVSWDPDALCNTRVGNSPLLHAFFIINVPAHMKSRGFKRCLESALKYKRSILFQKDNRGRTAFKLALENFGEKIIMTILRETFTETSGHLLLHDVLLHEQKYLNLFLRYFSNLYHLRDEQGRTLTQAMLAKKRDYLEENPMLWMNLSTDQLEEKDPHTTLRPFAAVASGDDANLDLSFRILRKHPSVMEVILEQREKLANEKNKKKRNTEESSEECMMKKVREATETSA